MRLDFRSVTIIPEDKVVSGLTIPKGAASGRGIENPQPAILAKANTSAFKQSDVS